MLDIDQLRDIVRARYRRVTAFRLGMVAAEHLGAAARDANPYEASKRGHEHFIEGVSLYELRAAQQALASLQAEQGAGR